MVFGAIQAIRYSTPPINLHFEHEHELLLGAMLIFKMLSFIW